MACEVVSWQKQSKLLACDVHKVGKGLLCFLQLLHGSTACESGGHAAAVMQAAWHARNEQAVSSTEGCNNQHVI
jgi:hypothetical protein